MKKSICLVLLTFAASAGCANNIDDLVYCDTDADCPGGYCHDTDGFCVSGPRQCLLDTDCAPPTTICADGQCVQGCVLGTCEVGEECNPVTGRCRFVQSCTIDSECDPPALVCIADFCEPGCALTGCANGFCDPYSGHCQGGTSCTGDGDCSPPTTVCEGDLCVAGCTVTGCTAPQECNQITGHCVGGSGGCTGDGDCDPPTTICLSEQCVPGCGQTGCTTWQQCSPSGRCEEITGLGHGEDCGSDANCASGHCMNISVYHAPQWIEFNVCSRACCSENDCPAGNGCLYHHGVKMCIPDDLYPPPYTFTLSAGMACDGTPGPSCRSGFCNPALLTCARTCCASRHCAGDACVWYHDDSGGHMFELCANIAGRSPLTTGAGCMVPLDCQSMICLSGQCADMCCTNGDCPGGYRCVQVLGQSANPMAASACVPGSPGAGADGTPCSTGASPNPQCQSGLCAAGTCRSPCCSDADCGGGLYCRPVDSGFDVDSDGTPDHVRACVP